MTAIAEGPTTFIGNIADWEDYLEYRELVNDVAAAEAELDRGEYLTQAEAKRDTLAARFLSATTV